MSISLIPTAIGGAQAAVSTASQIANLTAGFTPRYENLDVITRMAKDIGSFVFDYIGEERLEAGNDITDHYAEDNRFMQDHCAVKPACVTMRGFVSESSVNHLSLFPVIKALTSALTPVTPYIGRYSPGTAAAMANAVDQTDQIINQLAQIQAIAGGIGKLLGDSRIGLLPGSVPRVRQAYDALNALRVSGTVFAVVTPWATFGGNNGNDLNGAELNGPMMIEHLVMVSPEETRGWADIVVRLKEIRVAPSLQAVKMRNARANDVETHNGAIAHRK